MESWPKVKLDQIEVDFNDFNIAQNHSSSP